MRTCIYPTPPASRAELLETLTKEKIFTAPKSYALARACIGMYPTFGELKFSGLLVFAPVVSQSSPYVHITYGYGAWRWRTKRLFWGAGW
jgi:hypothetical protein